MKSRKFAILALAIAAGILVISLIVPKNDVQKVSTPASSRTPPTRTYYIAAENTTWNYAPTAKTK
jgi:hypothetical protein